MMARFSPDNLLPTSPVYSADHCNLKEMAWKEARVLFVTEHGQSARDEISLVRPNENYGWRLVSGAETQNGMQVAYFYPMVAT
jgi:glucose/arabinose dehydrogenase